MPAPVQSKSANQKIWSSRALALQTLLKVEQKKLFADDTFHALADKSQLSKEDRALAFEIVNGVLRHRGNLDWRLNALTSKPLLGLPTIVVMILRLGAYQLLHLDRVPDSAAVNESVKLAKRVKGRDWSGVVNGVLRNLLRQSEPPEIDPSENPVQTLERRYSCPSWLTARWIDRLGFDHTERVCQQTLGVPPLTLRTNMLRCDRGQLKKRLEREGHTVTFTEVSPLGVNVEKCGSLSSLGPLQDGWCYVEDEAAQLVPLLLDIQPGQRVLDACAAPGGKSTHVAALLGNQGEIIAVDRSTTRLETLQKNVDRLGITCLRSMVGAWLDGQPLPSETAESLEPGFDRILVDAPCSGLGILRRHPEAKWQRSVEQLSQHQIAQIGILHQVNTYLRPGGVLVYSVCSAEPEETTQVISRFCLDHPEFQLERSDPFLPSGSQSLMSSDGNLLTLGSMYDMDGFFAVRLRRV